MTIIEGRWPAGTRCRDVLPRFSPVWLVLSMLPTIFVLFAPLTPGLLFPPGPMAACSGKQSMADVRCEEPGLTEGTEGSAFEFLTRPRPPVFNPDRNRER
jgi:hypothetical protein